MTATYDILVPVRNNQVAGVLILGGGERDSEADLIVHAVIDPLTIFVGVQEAEYT